MAYNILSCKGFGEATSWIASAPCMKARFGIVILFFLTAIVRKWGFELLGQPYNFWIGEIAGIIAYLVTVSITGSMKIAFGVGFLAAMVGGYFGGVYLGESSSE